MGIAAVSFKEKNGIEIVIYPQGEWDNIDFDTATFEEDTEVLTENGCNDRQERSADFYYVLKVEIVSSNCSKISCSTGDMNGVNGNDTFSPHSPKVVTEDWLSEQSF